jgi:hypothetical protein
MVPHILVTIHFVHRHLVNIIHLSTNGLLCSSLAVAVNQTLLSVNQMTASQLFQSNSVLANVCRPNSFLPKDVEQVEEINIIAKEAHK